MQTIKSNSTKTEGKKLKCSKCGYRRFFIIEENKGILKFVCGRKTCNEIIGYSRKNNEVKKTDGNSKSKHSNGNLQQG